MGGRGPPRDDDDWVAGMFDWLAEIDDAVRSQDESVSHQTREIVEAIEDRASSMEETRSVLEEILSYTVPEVYQIEHEDPAQFPIDMSHDVPASTASTDEETQTRSFEFEYAIDSVVLGWPSGTNNLVGVQLRLRSGERLIPRNEEDEFIAADDFTDRFPLKVKVEAGSDIVAHFVNNDNVNSHFVNIIPNIVVV